MKKLIGMLAVASLPAIAAAQAVPQAAATYVKKAGAGDLYERQSSELLLTSTKNPKLKAFAREMITDHTKTTADVKAGAKRAGMTPRPPMLNAMQMADMRKLRAAHGTARDALYIKQQKASHEQALMVHQTYEQTGTVAPLKTAAGEVVPIVQHHIEELNAM